MAKYHPRGQEPFVHIVNPLPADPPTSRRTARRIPESAMILAILRSFATSVRTQAPDVRAEHGGTVPNAYRYPASTQTLTVATDPRGRAVVHSGEIPANKATVRGASATSPIPG